MEEELTAVQADDIAAFVHDDARVTGPEAGARITVCHKCDRLLPDDICGETGAAMHTRTWLAAATCPLGKW